MSDLKNILNWSISRADTFTYCKKKYYLSYYESWNGWERSTEPRKQLAYFLKKRQFIDMWIGDIVHRAIKFSIDNIIQVDKKYIIDNLQKRIEFDFNNSRNRTKLNSKPKDFWLYEHYRNKAIDSIEKYVDKAKISISNYFESDLFEEIKIAKQKGEIIYLDNGNINEMLFIFKSIPIFAIPDLCYKDQNGSYNIVDWKTGKSTEEELTLQLKMYSLRLHSINHINPIETEVNAFAFYLPSNIRNGRRVNLEDITFIEGYCLDSFNEMKEILINIENNIPKEEHFFPMTKNINKCQSCVFYEICREQL